MQNLKLNYQWINSVRDYRFKLTVLEIQFWSIDYVELVGYAKISSKTSRVGSDVQDKRTV